MLKISTMRFDYWTSTMCAGFFCSQKSHWVKRLLEAICGIRFIRIIIRSFLCGVDYFIIAEVALDSGPIWRLGSDGFRKNWVGNGNVGAPENLGRARKRSCHGTASSMNEN